MLKGIPFLSRFKAAIYKGEGPLMYRTNTDLEESILRISGWFFLPNSERDPVFNGVARRSALSRSPGGPFFFTNLLRSSIHIRSNLLPGIKNGHKVQALFVNVIYEDQVLYAIPKNEVLFVRIKLLYAVLSPFQIQFLWCNCLKYSIFDILRFYLFRQY